MSLITIDQLDMAVPKARYEDLVRYIDFLNEGMEKFEIDTPNRIAAFIAQLAHESADFRSTEENLNYSWQALRATWPARFPSDAFAQRYHREPERIANLVYAGPHGNGDGHGGDSLDLPRCFRQYQPRQHYLVEWLVERPWGSRLVSPVLARPGVWGGQKFLTSPDWRAFPIYDA